MLLKNDEILLKFIQSFWSLSPTLQPNATRILNWWCRRDQASRMLAILQRCAGSSCQSTRLVRPEMLDRLCHTTVGELTSLSAINVETRNHAESQNQRLVKAAAAGDTDDSDRRKHSKLCEPLMAAWDSSHYVTYTYRKKLTCLHVITENLHPSNNTKNCIRLTPRQCKHCSRS